MLIWTRQMDMSTCNIVVKEFSLLFISEIFLPGPEMIVLLNESGSERHKCGFLIDTRHA